MRYEISEGVINIFIRAANGGKFRFKTRPGKFRFGESFATQKKKFTDEVYLEWQIGYDATIEDIASGKKTTHLKHLKFIGANGKKKSPFELSELLSVAVKSGLIPIDRARTLLQEIKLTKDFIADRPISVSSPKKTTIAGIIFHEAAISLPTFFADESLDGTQVEVSIEKQQYATGVQPMVYFSIPVTVFANGNTYLGRASTAGEELEYEINKKNAEMLLLAFRIFGACSPSHNHDVREILTLLISDFEKKK